MFGYLAAALCAVIACIQFLIIPVVRYFYDPKGLRKYPGMTPLSGFSNIPYMLASIRGDRSQKLAELHQKHPIIRIGPNALSFGDHRAIKVCATPRIFQR